MQSRHMQMNLGTRLPVLAFDLQRTSSSTAPAALSELETGPRCRFHNRWTSGSRSGYGRAQNASIAPIKHTQGINLSFVLGDVQSSSLCHAL